jgi:PPP family 3-phenylpropionic acid transporter
MRADSDSTPYWRLSSYYFFYFAALGAFLPYWSLYLRHRGFEAVEIGGLMALVAATKILAPYIWGWIADHGGRRLLMIRLASFVSVVCFTGVFVPGHFLPMALAMFCFSFFWNAGLPQFEVTTLRFLGDEPHRYSVIRLWGSIGFIVTVASLGIVLDRSGIGALPVVLLGLYVFIWLSTLCVPENEGLRQHTVAGLSILQVLRQPVAIVALTASFLMQFGFGPYYTFFSIHLENHDYSKTVVGVFWAIGVIAEIVIFLLMYRLLPAVGAKRLLILCFGFAALRWWLIGFFVAYPWVLALAQSLHAFSFGVFHAVMIHLIHQLFPGRYQGRGQALYSSLSFGAGGALGAWLSGYVWDTCGAAAVFSISVAASLLGLVIVATGMRRSNEMMI